MAFWHVGNIRSRRISDASAESVIRCVQDVVEPSSAAHTLALVIKIAINTRNPVQGRWQPEPDSY